MASRPLFLGNIDHSNGRGDSHSAASISTPVSNKRSSDAANLDNNCNSMPIKRRATKACTACRARKVRCDVMQCYHVTANGDTTCSNCFMDSIKCVTVERKWRKKRIDPQPATVPAPDRTCSAYVRLQTRRDSTVNLADIASSESRRSRGPAALSNDGRGSGADFCAPQHVPHSIFSRHQSLPAPSSHEDLTHAVLDRTTTHLTPHPARSVSTLLPGHLKPPPQHMSSADIDYLFANGALSIPNIPLRDALFQSYFEFSQPYMPLLDFHELMEIVEDSTGAAGCISLLLFQAIMFVGTAFVDIQMLRNVGYSNRKMAMKAFFQKARVLYDFDYELDRLSLVQSLLLMTSWSETPNEQKDTWHWMGIALSLAYRIGLHRNPENSNMEPSKKKLWKRIWWSCVMRDQLIALEMRRPARVKGEDYDVPMLTEDDFNIGAVPKHITVISKLCYPTRDVESQRELALMCIAKAKLSLCISRILNTQYSVLFRCQGMQGTEEATQSTAMLFPNKLDQMDDVRHCDRELIQWLAELPEVCQYSSELGIGDSAHSIFVNRALLHMVYFTAVSALHRPRVLPPPAAMKPGQSRELQHMSRRKLREASRGTARISRDLYTYDLEKYLPTTGVTALLPALIIHLLDMKSHNDNARQVAMVDFCRCMLVLESLRGIYALADFASQFLEAVIRKFDIDMSMRMWCDRLHQEKPQDALTPANVSAVCPRSQAAHWTPSPSDDMTALSSGSTIIFCSELDYHTVTASNNLHSFSTPNFESEDASPLPLQHSTAAGWVELMSVGDTSVDPDLNEILLLDTGSDMWNVSLEEGAHSDSNGSMADTNWVDHSRGWSHRVSPSPDSTSANMASKSIALKMSSWDAEIDSGSSSEAGIER